MFERKINKEKNVKKRARCVYVSVGADHQPLHRWDKGCMENLYPTIIQYADDRSSNAIGSWFPSFATHTICVLCLVKFHIYLKIVPV